MGWPPASSTSGWSGAGSGSVPAICVQLICEGKPYQKPEHTLGEGTVGLDLGPSTLPWWRTTAARLEPFCAELDPQAAQIRREQRHLDRQRRANNPDNYLPDGRVKKGRTRPEALAGVPAAATTQARLADRQRKQAAHRKSLHGRLAHQIVRQGSTFLLEKVSYRAWQRRYGRSIQRRAPGMFVQILTRLAASAGGQVHHRSRPARPNCPRRVSVGRVRRNRCRCGCTTASVWPPDAAGSLLRLPDPVCGSQTPTCSTRTTLVRLGRVRSRSCGRRGSRPIPQLNRQAEGPPAPPTCGGGRLPCVRAGRPQQVHQPTPRARMLYRHVRESRVAEAVVWARTSRIHPGEWLRLVKR